MQWIRTILTELFGLFVDDGVFALVIIAWLAFSWLVLPRIVGPDLQAALLLAGLLVALVESTLRRARS